MTLHRKPGQELKDWKSASDKQELLEMANKYLCDDGNGQRLWLSDREDGAAGQLRYPADKEK